MVSQFTDPLSCHLRVERFRTIDCYEHSQLDTANYHQGDDPHFPAAERAIAPVGSNCGDSAHGINDPCTKYDHWDTIANIASSAGRDVAVFGSQGPQAADVGQGELGTCYFLSAISSIADTHPEVLEEMFVRQDLWAKGIYTTKWLINGMESFIEVDSTLPTNPDTHSPYFVHPPAANYVWWAAILEKTWAKIFSSYKATEAGWFQNPIAAITRAPTLDIRHLDDPTQADKEYLWNLLIDGTVNKWPMGAGSLKGEFGLARGHQYVTMGAAEDAQFGRVVTLRNPWRADFYNGAVPNTNNNDGIFTMTFDEYYSAIMSTDISLVQEGYGITSTELSSGGKGYALKFATTVDEKFTISAIWPSQRMMEPCQALDPQYVMIARKFGTDNVFHTSLNPAAGSNSAVIAIPDSTGGGGPGTYHVAFKIVFPSGNYAGQVYLNVYSSEAVDFYEADTHIEDLLMGMLGAQVSGGGPCDVMSITGEGLWEVNLQKTFQNVPTYWRVPDQSAFAYYSSAEDQWLLMDANKWNNVQNGEMWRYAQVTRDQLTCGCEDNPSGIPGFNPVILCADASDAHHTYGNVKCTGAQYSDLVQSACPKTCDVGICSDAFPDNWGSLSEAPAPAAPNTEGQGPVPVPSPARRANSVPSPSPTRRLKGVQRTRKIRKEGKLKAIRYPPTPKRKVTTQAS